MNLFEENFYVYENGEKHEKELFEEFLRQKAPQIYRCGTTVKQK